jgi:hypothetical protein
MFLKRRVFKFFLKVVVSVSVTNYRRLPQATSLERVCREELLDPAGMMTLPT